MARQNASIFHSRHRKPQQSHPMITRFIIAASVALFFTPALPGFAQEHPEHPKKKEAEHPKKGAEKEVTKTEISAGIKKHIASETKKSSDGKFHTKYEGKDLA